MIVRYNDSQKLELIKSFKTKLLNGEAKGYEIVIALITMVKAKRLRLSDVKPILISIFDHDLIGLLEALEKGRMLIDDELVDSVIRDVEQGKYKK